MKFEIPFFGHENIRSLHPKTIEITKDTFLTTNGDCIVGIGSKYGCKEIPEDVKEKLRDPNTVVNFSLIVNDFTFKIKGRGHKDLIFSDPNDIVLRKSNFICPRTIAVNCNMASDSIPRKIIQVLQNPKVEGKLVIEIN